MKLTLNGEIKEFITETEEFALKTLLQQLNLHPQLVVVELNGIIINKTNWEDQLLKDGDILEIVTIVGGGS